MVKRPSKSLNLAGHIGSQVLVPKQNVSPASQDMEHRSLKSTTSGFSFETSFSQMIDDLENSRRYGLRMTPAEDITSGFLVRSHVMVSVRLLPSIYGTLDNLIKLPRPCQ